MISEFLFLLIVKSNKNEPTNFFPLTTVWLLFNREDKIMFVLGCRSKLL